MTLKEVLKKIDHHVWTSEPDVAEFIAAIMKMHGASHVLELGVFKGGTSCHMIDALPEKGTYTGIDVQDWRPDAVKEYMKENKAKFILGDSQHEIPKLKQNHFDLVFIDSDHTFEHLSKEFRLCEKAVKQNALVLIHDSNLPQLQKWINYIRPLAHFEVLDLNTSGNRGMCIVKMKWGKPQKAIHPKWNEF